MLEVTFRLNGGQVIGEMTIRRLEPLDDAQCLYPYNYAARIRPIEGGEVICHGVLTHNYDDGATTLVRKVCQRIEAALAEKERETA